MIEFGRQPKLGELVEHLPRRGAQHGRVPPVREQQRKTLCTLSSSSITAISPPVESARIGSGWAAAVPL